MRHEVEPARDAFALVHEGRCCADTILEHYAGVRVAKAINVGTTKGFTHAVAILALELRQCVRGAEEEALRKAISALNIDWHRTTAAQRAVLFRHVRQLAAQSLGPLSHKIAHRLWLAGAGVIAATRRNVRKQHGLQINESPSKSDLRVNRMTAQGNAMFVRRAYERKLDSFAGLLLHFVSECLAEGQSLIVETIANAARKALTTDGTNYWEIVAGAFIGRSRAYAQVSGYQDGGIKKYEIHSVKDERTSRICWAMDGRCFSVAQSIRHLGVTENCAALKTLQNANCWPQLDREGTIEASGAKRLHLASAPSSVLSDLGLSLPPYHALCRTTTVPF